MKPTAHVSTLQEWNAQKGTGVLLHGETVLSISASQFSRHHRKPREGDRVLYTLRFEDDQSLPTLDNAVLLRAHGLFYDLRAAWPALLLVLPLLALLVGPMPYGFWHGLAYLFVISLLTFMLYHCSDFLEDGIGKFESHSVLHFLELFGGWFGSITAQRKLHFNEHNLRYQAFFWMAVILWQGLSLDAIFDWKIASEMVSNITPVIDILSA